MSLTRSFLTASVAAAGLMSAGFATAQSADFVLFGEPNPAAAGQAAEQVHVAPVSAPYYHEDSFNTSDLRAWFVYHDFPQSSTLAGGNAKVYALQVRLALTEQLQFLAVKDGYTDLDSGLLGDDGWNDIAAGLKWSFLQDFENQLHAAVGFTYEIGIGDDEVFGEDEELRLFASVDKGFDKLHTGLTANLIIPTDGEDPLGNSTSLFLHARADYYLCEWFSPTVNLNGYFTLDEGDNTPLNFNGVDVANLGGGKSEDVITAAVGGEFRVLEGLGLRGAYEFPLTDNDDLFGYRWTFSAVYSF